MTIRGSLIGGLLFGVLLHMSVAANLHGQDRPEPGAPNGTGGQLENVRQTARELENAYRSQARLAKKGSVSQQKLRRAKHEYQLAKLDLLALEQAGRRKQVELAKAQLEFEYRSGEFDISSRLFQRGSISAMQFERARFARDIAQLELEAVQDPRRTKLHDIKIAERKLTLIAQEHQRIKQLWESQMVSRPVFERWSRYVRDFKQELAIAKKALGVRVIVVDPPSTSTLSPNDN